MQWFFAFCGWLQQTLVGTHMHESAWLFPAVESLHILLGTVPLVVATAILNARLLGWALTEVPVSELARRTLPWAWAGFAVQVVTGILLFSADATKYADTHIFYIKMLLIVLAGANALLFNRTTYRSVSSWDTSSSPPLAAKLMGFVSLILWLGVVVMGRVLNSAVTLVQ
jgi:hypothetical protein